MSISRPSSSRRRPVRWLVGAVLALCCAAPAPAAAGVADQIGATFGLILQEVVGAFPAVEGLVVAVEGPRIYMDPAAQQGVQPGQEFTIFRKGEVFRHPVTHRPLGRFEEVLGHAQVERVLPRFSEAMVIPLPGKPPVRPEDGVRITKGRIRVAVPPMVDLTRAQPDLRRVPFMLALGLDQTKRFLSMDPGRRASSSSPTTRGPRSCSCGPRRSSRSAGRSRSRAG